MHVRVELLHAIGGGRPNEGLQAGAVPAEAQGRVRAFARDRVLQIQFAAEVPCVESAGKTKHQTADSTERSVAGHRGVKQNRYGGGCEINHGFSYIHDRTV